MLRASLFFDPPRGCLNQRVGNFGFEALCLGNNTSSQRGDGITRRPATSTHLKISADLIATRCYLYAYAILFLPTPANVDISVKKGIRECQPNHTVPYTICNENLISAVVTAHPSIVIDLHSSHISSPKCVEYILFMAKIRGFHIERHEPS